MKLKSVLTEADLAELEAVIKKQENFTSGEIVPAFLMESRSYRFASLQMILIGAVFFVLSLFVYDQLQFFPLKLGHFAFSLILGVITGYALSLFPFIKRKWVGTAELAEAVYEKACALMLQLGVTQTQQRAGVLIFVSYFERQIIILADQGIYPKVPQQRWDEISKQMSQILRSEGVKKAYLHTIGEVGALLKENFPIDPSDTNELPNHVRMPK